MNLMDASFRSHPEWDAWLLMTVHDEVVVEVKDEFAQVVAEVVEDCMLRGAQKYMKLCPAKVDLKIADCWQK